MKKDVTEVIKIGGALVAFIVGSGFATGQELLQYFASFGLFGILGCIIAMLFYIYLSVSFLKLGKENNITSVNEVFFFYCGEKAGRIFEFVAFSYMILSFITFLSGAGASFHQYLGLPNAVGSLILAVASMITAILGLRKVVDIIGAVGPVIIVTTIATAAIFLIQNFGGLAEGFSVVSTLEIPQPSDNWLISGFMYASFMSLSFTPFLPMVGATANSTKNAVWGGIVGVVSLGVTIITISLAFLSDIEMVHAQMIPTLYIAGQISPFLGLFFTVIVLLGIYTSAAPMLWNFSARFAKEKTKKFNLLVITLGVVCLVSGAVIPFDVLVNKIYSFYGYIGAVFMVFMMVKQVRVHNEQKEYGNLPQKTL